jgi:hypothetical protein
MAKKEEESNPLTDVGRVISAIGRAGSGGIGAIRGGISDTANLVGQGVSSATNALVDKTFTAGNFPVISGLANSFGAAPNAPTNPPSQGQAMAGALNAPASLQPQPANIQAIGAGPLSRQGPGGGGFIQQAQAGRTSTPAPFVPSEANNFGVTVARGLNIQRPGDPRQSAGDYALSEQGIRGAIDYSTRRAADANMAFASRLKKMASRLAGNKNITPAMAQAVLSSMATRFRPSAGTGLAAQGLASSASRYASDRGVSGVVASARAKRDLDPNRNFVVTDPITGASQVIQIGKSSGDVTVKKVPSSLSPFGGEVGDGDDGSLDPNSINIRAIAMAVARDKTTREALLNAVREADVELSQER